MFERFFGILDHGHVATALEYNGSQSREATQASKDRRDIGQTIRVTPKSKYREVDLPETIRVVPTEQVAAERLADPGEIPKIGHPWTVAERGLVKPSDITVPVRRGDKHVFQDEFGTQCEEREQESPP